MKQAKADFFCTLNNMPKNSSKLNLNIEFKHGFFSLFNSHCPRQHGDDHDSSYFGNILDNNERTDL